MLDKSIGKCRFTVINMRNYREVTDVVHDVTGWNQRRSIYVSSRLWPHRRCRDPGDHIDFRVTLAYQLIPILHHRDTYPLFCRKLVSGIDVQDTYLELTSHQWQQRLEQCLT